MSINELVGKTLKSVELSKDENAIWFLTDDDVKYVMRHNQDCCEIVSIESIVGDLEDLVGTPILVAEERTSGEAKGRRSGTVPDIIWIMAWEARQSGSSYYKENSCTWTFYTFRTIKGTVDIRWYGTSNGYYSESVDFELDTPRRGWGRP